MGRRRPGRQRAHWDLRAGTSASGCSWGGRWPPPTAAVLAQFGIVGLALEFQLGGAVNRQTQVAGTRDQAQVGYRGHHPDLRDLGGERMQRLNRSNHHPARAALRESRHD